MLARLLCTQIPGSYNELAEKGILEFDLVKDIPSPTYIHCMGRGQSNALPSLALPVSEELIP